MSDDWDDYIPFEGRSRPMTDAEKKRMEELTRQTDEDIKSELERRKRQRQS